MKRFEYLLFALCSLVYASCEDDQDPEYEVIGVIPTVIITSNTPGSLDLGATYDIDITFYSPNVNITALELVETIGTGTETIIETVPFSDFDRFGSKVRTFNYAPPATAQAGDEVTVAIRAQAANGLSALDDFTAVISDCPSASLEGTYLATTMATTPFDGPYDNTGSPYEVTITDNGDGTFDITDITGGLYGEFYAGIYTNLGVAALPATFDRDGCGVSVEDVPEDPGFQGAFGDNLLDATGIVDAMGNITINFTNDAGDAGTSVLEKQ